MTPIAGVPIFRWCPRVDAAGTTTFRAIRAQFGDGYAQRSADGIHNAVQEWPLQFVGTDAYVAAIKAFLEERAGWKAFHWTPPLSDLGLYVCAAHEVRALGNRKFQLSATFTQTFRA